VRWTGGDRATGSGLRVGYTGVNGRSSDIAGEVDLVLCAERSDCGERPWD
jgi:hypothetical protein